MKGKYVIIVYLKQFRVKTVTQSQMKEWLKPGMLIKPEVKQSQCVPLQKYEEDE